MKKIKILEAIRQGKTGGGETHVLQLCTHIDRSIFEPVVLSFTDGTMIDSLKSIDVRTKVIHTEVPFDFRVWNRVKRFMKEEGVDLVHAHGTRANSNVFHAAESLGLPLLYTVHGWSFHPGQNRLVRMVRETSEKFLTRKANRTICVSKSNQGDGIDLFNMQRSEVIYNSVDFGRFDFGRPYYNVRKQLRISQHAKVIGFIVRMTAQKDPFTMLKAMQVVAGKKPDTVLLMVGDGDLKSASMKMAKDMGIQNQVIFQPFRNDVPEILNAIDIYCLPSLWEGFPIGVLEAMAMKKAVVATPVDGTRELVINGRTGLLVPPRDPAQLAQALLLLLNDESLRRSLADEAYSFVHKNFDVKESVDAVQDIYRSIYGNSRVAFEV